MKKRLFLLIISLITLAAFSQNTNPFLSPMYSPTNGEWNKGTLQVDGDFVLPTTLNSFTNPTLRNHGKMYYSTVDSVPKYHNGVYWQAIVSRDYLSSSKGVNFNSLKVNLDQGMVLEPEPGNEIREIGNVVKDEITGLFLMLYSETEIPYADTNVHVGLATSPNGKAGTWTKVGQIISTPSEDPFLVIENGKYFIFVEKKDDLVPSKHAGIELFTTTDIINISPVSVGIVVPNGSSGEPDSLDASSPTIIKRNGVHYMFYEGRANTGTGFPVTLSGCVMLATSTDSDLETWTKLGPVIGGQQLNGIIDADKIVQWCSHIVPDDIFEVGGKTYLAAHAYNDTDYTLAILELSESLERAADAYNTWVTIDDGTGEDYNGSGNSHVFIEGKLCFMHEVGGVVYVADTQTRNNDNWAFSSKTTANSSTIRLFGGNRNKIIDFNITSNQTFYLPEESTNIPGNFKVLRNPSAFTVTLDPQGVVTIDGSTSNITITTNSVVWIYCVAPNVWKTMSFPVSVDLSPYATKANPTFTGTVIIPAAGLSLSGGDSANLLLGNGGTVARTTAVRDQTISSNPGTSGALTSSTTFRQAVYQLEGQISSKANIASPIFTGDPQSVTPATTDNDTSIQTTAGVKNKLDTYTGWGQYSDGVYTVGSPLVINSGVTSTLTNNAGTSITTQLPTGVTNFWNNSTNKITPQNDGDFYMVNVRFTASSSVLDGFIEVGLDIGAPMNLVTSQGLSLRKGSGNPQVCNIAFPVYSGSTFVANGGEIKVTSVTGNTSIYNIVVVVNRVHKAK